MSRKSNTAVMTDRILPEYMSREATTAILNLNTGTLSSRNIRIHNRRTSIRLDDRMWKALNEIARIEGCTIHDLCTAVYDYKDADTGFTTALRVFLMNYYRVTAQQPDSMH